LYGAHLDHLGYRYAPARPGDPPDPNRDVIYNGADDDGSGSSALLAIAKALAAGPQPKRSVVFVWHTNEENGLGGSRFMAEHPIVPLDKVQAQINIDMIGRNRHDDPAESNTVFIVGADRISTDLHNLLVATNGRLRDPLTLDFAFNDPADANSFYTRSDHFSYALRGVPVAFFFTGTHPDYHQVTDHVDKILFPKLMRVAQLAYELGFAAADRPGALRRDNLGPRAGRGFQGPIE
jgi:Zn-dependent M28 family amino/carboxypeptidase